MNDLVHHRKMQARIDELTAETGRLTLEINRLASVTKDIELKLCQCEPSKKKS